jgi:hypothetical protein
LTVELDIAEQSILRNKAFQRDKHNRVKDHEL